MGLAFYGRSFQVANAPQANVGSPSAGAGSAGPYTREAGYMGYNEICALDHSWSHKWSNEHAVPYVHNSNQWIGYDNVKSIEMKIDFGNSLNLAGVMIWSVETDDFRGKCGGKYPLLKAINNKLGNSQGNSNGNGGGEEEVEVPPEPEQPEETNPSQPENAGDCKSNGFFVQPNDCSRYYQCVNGIRYDFQCNHGLYFDVTSASCNWPDLVKCN